MTMEIIQNIYDEWAFDALKNIESKRKSWLLNRAIAYLLLLPPIYFFFPWRFFYIPFLWKILLIVAYIVLIRQTMFVRADRFKNNYLNYLNDFRTRIIETFVGIIFPQAEDINFYPAGGISQEEFLGMDVFPEAIDCTKLPLNRIYFSCRKIFGREARKYLQFYSENLLTFKLNGFVHRLANVTAPVFSQGSSIYVFSGMFYDFSFPLQKNNNLTIMLPKKLANDWVTLKQVYEKERHQWVIARISTDSLTPSPIKKLGGFLGGSPQVYYNYKEMENLSMENEEIEDNFYVFSWDENNARKLLSYRFMETLANLFLSPNRKSSSYWLVFKQNKFLALQQKIDLGYFNPEGKKSTNIENLEENFYRLAQDLSCLFKLDLV